jgi:hypothetical protein
MVNVAKCPNCQAQITRVTISDVCVDAEIGHPTWHGVAYTCPSCSTVISVGVDPFALKADTVDGVVNEIKKLLR